jgi:hypothetical protein
MTVVPICASYVETAVCITRKHFIKIVIHFCLFYTLVVRYLYDLCFFVCIVKYKRILVNISRKVKNLFYLKIGRECCSIVEC